MKRTRYAEAMSNIQLADSRIAELEAQNKALLKLGDTLVKQLNDRLDLSTDAMQKKKVRRDAKDMIVQRVPSIKDTIELMHNNFDKAMREQFDAVLKNVSTKSFEQYMKGHEDKEVENLRAQLPNLIAKQNENRKTEIGNQEQAQADARSKLGNPFKRAWLAFVHLLATAFTKQYATIDEAVAQKREAKTYFAHGRDTRVSEVEIKGRKEGRKGKKVSAKEFGKGKTDSLVAKSRKSLRRAEELHKQEEEKAAGKGKGYGQSND